MTPIGVQFGLITPPHFDRNYRDLLRHIIDNLPERTVDYSADQIFSRDVTDREVANAKARIIEHLKTAKGIDAHSYADVLTLSNSRVAELLSMCLSKRLIPTAWKATLLAAVPKAKGPYSDPENYRMIALECCMLKLMTLILEARIREYTERENIIPPSQNGFRPGYRTENNPFLIRVAMETAHRQGKPLFAAFVDFRNAFPSVDRSLLWAKMLDCGISGPVFDWLRALYADMRYYLRRDGGYSNPMTAELGILMGDPASPLAFLLYVSDFTTPAHSEDIVMDGSVIAHLEHADDLALLSMSPEGLQSKLDSLAQWASKNQMEVNTLKTVVMIFPPPRRTRAAVVPAFSLYGQNLDIVDRYKYVGVLLKSNSPNAWDELITGCHNSARRAANMCFFVESRTGQLPPWEGRMMYNAQLDSRLTHAVEVSGVGTVRQLERLESVQLYYLRRILGLQSRSQKCILYTEMGIWPLRFRRLHLILGYPAYLLDLPLSHYARKALHQTMDNSLHRRSGWWHDLVQHLSALDLVLSIDASSADVHRLRERLRSVMCAQLEGEIHSSPKLDILQQRVDYEGTRSHKPPTIAFRQYLLISNKAPRKALTRMLLSDHRLSVETGRWEGTNREDRKCRECELAIEEPLHVLFLCRHNAALNALRDCFWDEIEAAADNPLAAIRSAAPLRSTTSGRSARLRLLLMAPATCVFALLSDKRTMSILAVFTERVFAHFDSLPRRHYGRQDAAQ